MRILYLADGGSIHTYKYIKFFHDQGHSVELISMRPIRDDLKKILSDKYESKLQSKNFLLHMLYTLINLPLIIRKIRKSKADIVHAHDVFAYGPFAYFSGRDYVINPWGSDILIMAKKNKFFSYFVKKILSKAKEVFYDGGEHIYKELLNNNVSETKIHKVCFGVDTELFKFDENKIIKNPTVFNIISTRNHEPVYDIETLLYAIPLVLKELNPNKLQVKFVICGQGSLTEELKSIAYSNYNREKGFAYYIRFTGRLTQEEMVNSLCGSKLYVSTSLSDAGLSASTAEAMSCELPVIITDFGDNANWVENDEYLFKPDNEKELANKILNVINKSKEELAANGKRNRDIIVEKNNIHKEMLKVQEVYSKLYTQGLIDQKII